MSRVIVLPTSVREKLLVTRKRLRRRAAKRRYRANRARRKADGG